MGFGLVELTSMGQNLPALGAEAEAELEAAHLALSNWPMDLEVHWTSRANQCQSELHSRALQKPRLEWVQL